MYTTLKQYSPRHAPWKLSASTPPSGRALSPPPQGDYFDGDDVMFNDGYSGIINGLVGTNINMPLALFQSAGLLNIRCEVDWSDFKIFIR